MSMGFYGYSDCTYAPTQTTASRLASDFSVTSPLGSGKGSTFCEMIFRSVGALGAQCIGIAVLYGTVVAIFFVETFRLD